MSDMVWSLPPSESERVCLGSYEGNRGGALLLACRADRTVNRICSERSLKLMSFLTTCSFQPPLSAAGGRLITNQGCSRISAMLMRLCGSGVKMRRIRSSHSTEMEGRP